MITKKKINQKDKRGFILDIFVGKPKDHCSLVSFERNSVRGNHFHKKSIQYSFILEGKLLMITSRVNKNGKYLGRKNRKIVRKNDLITHKPFMAHVFKAKTNSKILAFADGLRGGKNYEKDTFRLKNKLI